MSLLSLFLSHIVFFMSFLSFLSGSGQKERKKGQFRHPLVNVSFLFRKLLMGGLGEQKWARFCGRPLWMTKLLNIHTMKKLHAIKHWVKKNNIKHACQENVF